MRFSTHVLIKRWPLLTLILIICLGTLLRLYKLGEIPTGFFADEAAIGVNAHLIATTLRDDHHVLLPVLFQSFDDYKSPFSIYPTVPFVLLFGLHEWVVRLVPALFGIADIIVVYFFTKQLFAQRQERTFVALLSAFFLAISPWHIQMSRVALDAMTAMLFFFVVGLYASLRISYNQRFFFLAAFSFALAMYTYAPIRIFLPTFLIILCLSSISIILKYKKYFLLSLLLFLALVLPLLSITLFHHGADRFQQVSIFTHPPTRESLLTHIGQNYLSHFSFDFLFLKGDAGMKGQAITRHSIEGMGELYLVQVLFIMLGCFTLFIKNKTKSALFLLITWLLLYPLGSIFTTAVSAQATRSFIGVIPFQILTAVGVYWFITFLVKRLRLAALPFLILFGALVLFSCYQYARNYFLLYPKYASDYWGWQYGPKAITQYFATHQQMYDDLVFPPAFNQPEIFLSFYFPHGCPKCLVGLPQATYDPNREQLFAITPHYLENKHLSFLTKKTIYYPNKQAAFYIGEIKKK